MSTIRVSGDSSGYYDLTVPSTAGTNTIDLSKLPVKDASNIILVDGLKHTNGTTAMTINSDGASNLTVPHFFAKETTAITVSSTQTTHTGFTIQSDSHSGWSGYTYTIPADCGGVWCLNTAVTFNGIGSGSWALLAIEINGSQVNTHDNYYGSGVTNQPFRGIHWGNFAAGTTLRFGVAQGNGSKTSDVSGGRIGYFSGWRVGSAIT